jgi:hypothetical protein
LAAKFRAAVDGLAGSGGVSVTLMTAAPGSGAAGKADGIRDVVVDDQFNIGSVTKSLAAAQVMQLVEAGELSLDDLALITFLRISGSTPGRRGCGHPIGNRYSSVIGQLRSSCIAQRCSVRKASTVKET